MRRFYSIIGMLLLLTSVGTVGLRLIEGADWLHCLYMTVITLATIGYNDDVIQTDAGKIFIMVFTISGLGIFTYSAFQLGQLIVGLQMRSLLEKRRMNKTIDSLRDHYIICGYGRMGATICEYLKNKHQPYVVLDIDENVFEDHAEHSDLLYMIGDSADDDVLRAAGIERARALASVLPTDADNVYVILSARMLRSDLQIISRAGEERAVKRMERAGANRVISPYASGAVKMARFMLSPSVEDFLEIADDEGTGMELADIQIREGSPYAGRELRETDLRDRGIMVIGIRRASGERLMPPHGTARLEPGDSLFAFGTSDAVNDMLSASDV